jgi:hypothetical protein
MMESERTERFVKPKVVLTEHKIKVPSYNFRLNGGAKERKSRRG